MSQEGATTLEQSIRALAAEGTLAALNEHLPILLERLVLPPDAEHRHTFEEAAARLRIPETTLRQRIKDGDLEVTPDGKRKFIREQDLIAYNRRLRDREKFKRDQESALALSASPEIAALLEPKKLKARK